MKRRTLNIIWGVIFVVFTVIAFMAPFAKTSVFWISYLFGLLSLGFQIMLSNKMLNGETQKSKFLSIPILYVGALYLIVQLIASLIMMAITGIPVWIAFIVDIMLLAIACIIIISADMARTKIEKTEEKVLTKTSFIRSSKVEVDRLLSAEKDPVIKRELEKLSDAIRYSDPMSSSELAEIEKQISIKIKHVATAGDDKLSVISEITELIKQRNNMCKAFK